MIVNKRLLKKIVILLIVGAELVIGYLFLSHYYQTRQIQGRFDTSEKVTPINKSSLVFPKSGEYEHYWEYQPSYIETVDLYWLSYKPTYHRNNDGLNDMSDYAIAKPKNSLRIMALGDSFTEGALVNTEDSWPEQLEALLNKEKTKYCEYENIEVINLGMGGFDIPYLVERYKRIGQKYDPDLIIWFESGSGFNRFVELITPLVDICNNEASEDQKNSNHHYCWVTAEEKIINSYNRNDLNDIILRSLDDFKQMLDFDKQKLIFFGYDNISEDQKSFLNQWQSIFPSAGFFFYLKSDYGLDSARYILPDGHPSIAGHEKIAEQIFEHLQKNELANCGK